MKTRNERRLIKIAECGNNESHKLAMSELRSINATYHSCNDWDGMVICDKDREFDCCLCFPHEERFGYSNPMEDTQKANLPLWKGSLSIIIFGVLVYFWDEIVKLLQ